MAEGMMYYTSESDNPISKLKSINDSCNHTDSDGKSAIIPIPGNNKQCMCTICGKYFTNDNEAYDPSKEAMPSNVKNGYAFKNPISKEPLVGTMRINEPESVKLDLDQEYTIPEGYHDGHGKLYTTSLGSYTLGNAYSADIIKNKIAWVNGQRIVGTLDIGPIEQHATAKPEDIVSGKTAWVNGQKITGIIPNIPREDQNLLAGESYTFPYGLSAGTTVISAATLASQTPATADASSIKEGKTAWVNGVKLIGTLNIDDVITERFGSTDATKNYVLGGKKFYSHVYNGVVSGSMVNHTGEDERLLRNGETFTIPEGYYDGHSSVRVQELKYVTIGDAKSEDIINGKIAWVNGQKVIGSIEILPEVHEYLDCGESYTVPAGYHTGESVVTANSLASQTEANAGLRDIVAGKTAWVNGQKLTGIMPDNGRISVTLESGEHYHIPEGYHDGAGWVWTKTLEQQTPGNAAAEDLLENKTAWVNGEKIFGQIINIGKQETDLMAGHNVSIERGYHDGTGVIRAVPLEGQTIGNATAENIENLKTAWVNGEQITGSLQLTGIAIPEKVLAGETFYNSNLHQKLTGTMPYNDPEVVNLKCSEEYDIALGYHNGHGRVIANSLASQTIGNAVNSDILEGKIAWVNGIEVVGAISPIPVEEIYINCDEEYIIPMGVHEEGGKIIANSLASQTVGDAISEEILDNKTAWVNGEQVIGSMPNIGEESSILLAGESHNISAGYHDGTGVIESADLASQTPGDAIDSEILIDKKAWVNGLEVTGSMPNIGKEDNELSAGGTHTISAGYHDGSGVITAKTLASQTISDAVSSEILDTKTAWVNGAKVIGSMPNIGKEDNELSAGESHTISAGYHDGTGTIVAKDLASQTVGNAVSSEILINKKAWVNGLEVIGSMPKINTIDITLDAGDLYTIPLGYHDGSGMIKAKSLSLQTEGTAISEDILDTKTAWVNGVQITGSMPNIGEESEELFAGGTHTISAGYHDGTGVITAKDLASQTIGDALAKNLHEGKIAWVNGEQIIGTVGDAYVDSNILIIPSYDTLEALNINIEEN